MDDYQWPRRWWLRHNCLCAYMWAAFGIAMGVIYLSNIELGAWYALENLATDTQTPPAPPPANCWLGITSPCVTRELYHLPS